MKFQQLIKFTDYKDVPLKQLYECKIANSHYFITYYDINNNANVSPTWDYIKDVAEASERRSQLRGSGLLLDAPKQPESPDFAVDALWTQKIAK